MIQQSSYINSNLKKKPLEDSEIKKKETSLNKDLNVSQLRDKYKKQDKVEELEDDYIDPALIKKITEKYKNKYTPNMITLFIRKLTVLPNHYELTPIPEIFKPDLKNKNDERDFTNAERTAVQIRRIEYAKAHKGKSTLIKKDIYINCDANKMKKIILIQIHWRKYFYRKRFIIFIQSNLRGYLIRKKIKEILFLINEFTYKLKTFISLIINIIRKKTLNDLIINIKDLDLKNYLQNKNDLTHHSIKISYKIRKEQFCFKIEKVIKRLILSTILYEIRQYADLTGHIINIQRFLSKNISEIMKNIHEKKLNSNFSKVGILIKLRVLFFLDFFLRKED